MESLGVGGVVLDSAHPGSCWNPDRYGLEMSSATQLHSKVQF